ncbi:unnamed protein product [Lactuca saligna]|uniref:Uncharacterized protein n=1 Tax=Lactuca saligna TaxID=75948 RepID=A0AA35ZF24_LACSI|nr:unnamed protein product [Lactuca saligna]
MAQEIEKEKPRIGQCLPLWEELRLKIKDWCAKFHVNENHADKVFDKRLVSCEEAHIALMELMKWRTEGLDPVYAQAIQLKQRDPVTGKLQVDLSSCNFM